MRSRKRGWAIAVVAMAILRSGPEAGARVFSGNGDGAAFSAEVTVTRAIVTEAGRRVREVPASRYRLERFASGRLRLTMRSTRDQPTSGPMADPYEGIVVEQDADGAIRLLRADGTPVPGAPPSATGLVPAQAMSSSGWIVNVHDVVERRKALTATLGARAGAVNGLDRYIVRDGNSVREVLVSPRWALPLEVNVLNGGTLEERHQFEYMERADGHLVRTRTRSESRLPDGSNQRMVSITALADVVIGGAQ
jgi:hypothetical protein